MPSRTPPLCVFTWEVLSVAAFVACIIRTDSARDNRKLIVHRFRRYKAMSQELHEDTHAFLSPGSLQFARSSLFSPSPPGAAARPPTAPGAHARKPHARATPRRRKRSLWLASCGPLAFVSQSRLSSARADPSLSFAAGRSPRSPRARELKVGLSVKMSLRTPERTRCAPRRAQGRRDLASCTWQVSGAPGPVRDQMNAARQQQPLKLRDLRVSARPPAGTTPNVQILLQAS